MIEFTIHNDSMSFHNVNITESYQFNLHNLTLASPYNDIRYANNQTIIATNQEQFNITLSPNAEIEVGDFEVVDTCTYNS